MNDYHYELNCGQYVLMDGSECLYGPYDEIAICLDKESGTLHKHGDPRIVDAWRQKTAKKFVDAGFAHLAEELVSVSGRFPLEEINKCISNSGYVGVFYKKLIDGRIDVLPFDCAPPP